MAFITQDNYVGIATAYANGFDSQVSSKDEYFDAVYQIVLLNVIRPEVDLLNVFWSTYLVQSDVLKSSSSLLGAVRAINNHVIVAGGFADVDTYLDYKDTPNPGNLTVPQTWADLSAAAGYTISAANIG